MIAGLRCSYCGAPAAFRAPRGDASPLLTCQQHADLPALDPVYGLADTMARVSYPALELRDMAPTAARVEVTR